MSNRSQSQRRKEREREAHRREILDAAEEVFVSRGYQQATVEQIAEAADFSVGTLYNFFKSKEEMYVQVLERVMKAFWSDFERRVMGEENAVIALENLIALRVTHWDAHRGFLHIFLERASGSPMDPEPVLPAQSRELYGRYLAEVGKVFERGMAQRVFGQADPVYLALCLEGIAGASAAYWAQHGANEPPSARIERVRDAFFRWIGAVSPLEAERGRD